MKQEPNNPFVLPGFGQQGEAAHNPLFAGLDMMRQAWQGMAGGAGHLDAATMAPMSLDDLDRRIRELQTVQNWLQLNVSMLASTIQGLEIQRSTLNTLKSFAGGAFAAGADAPSSKKAEAEAGAIPPAYAQAAGDWWQMVQQQFEQLAAATTASLQGMADAQQASAEASSKPAGAPAKSAKPAARPAAKAGARGTRAAAKKPEKSGTTRSRKA